MPIYTAVLTIPANTTIAAPVSTSLYPSDRWIEHVEVQFPLRCALQVGVQIRDRSALFAPAAGSAVDQASQWLRADNFVVAWDEEYDLGAPGHEVVIWAYNIDKIFAHTIDVRMVISPVTLRQLMRRQAAGQGSKD